MRDHSIYTAGYNLQSMGFSWRETLDNWTRFLDGEGQIVIAINTSTDNTFEAVTEYTKELAALPGNQVEYTVFQTNIDYSNPLFDGAIKNEALKGCNRRYCTLLDMDEVIYAPNRSEWQRAMEFLGNSQADALLMPVIDIFHDDKSFKSLGRKWYLHKNLPWLHRGRVDFAVNPDGSTNIKRSDTCEILTFNDRLAPSIFFPEAHEDSVLLRGMELNAVPYVVHLGWRFREQRLRQSAFWAPVWCQRAGQQVEKPLTAEDLDTIPYYPHNLPHWNEE